MFKPRHYKPVLIPGHPQANGQTEVTNRTLLKIIKTKLDDTMGAWLEELPNVLWAYRTTTRTPTGETPFRLTYGIEAVIPVEVGVTSTRREAFHEESNDDHLQINLDCLDEVREEASIRVTKYQQRMADYYNKRVKLRRLDIGDLVLRKVTPTTKIPPRGSLAPHGKGCTGSFTTLNKAATIWKPWTDRNSLGRGILNI